MPAGCHMPAAGRDTEAALGACRGGRGRGPTRLVRPARTVRGGQSCAAAVLRERRRKWGAAVRARRDNGDHHGREWR